ncbi:MAG: CRISPR-associated protein Cas5 [Hydrogenobaculum sp.]
MIRLEIHQESAHFRIPTVGNPLLSYPLPPPSTVYGFLRAITNYESINFENTRLSIQGTYKSISFEKERLVLRTKTETKTNIIPIQKLHQCSWVVHVKSSKEFENKIINALKNTSRILSLGRREDLIIDFKVFTVEEKPLGESDEITQKSTRVYKAWNENENIRNGSIFRMALDTIVDENKKIVAYKQISLIYMDVKNLIPSKFYNKKQHSKTYDGEYLIEWII